MNKAILIGNLTKDPELRSTQTGKQVASCAIATNKSYKDQAGVKQNVATFHNLVIWGKPAEVFAQYMKKGHKCGIEGEINNRSYEHEGVKKYISEIVVREFHFLQPKPQGQENAGGQDAYSQPAHEDNGSQVTPAVNSSEEEIKVENIPF